MQLDPILGLLLILSLFITIGLSLLITGFWKQLWKRATDRSKSEIQVDIIDSVFTEEAGMFVHYIHLEISKSTKETVRIANMAIYNKRGREMPIVLRGHTHARTDFEIYNTSVSWFAFCQRLPIGESDIAKLKLTIEVKGKKTHRQTFNSTMVSSDKFPSGKIFKFY